MSDGHDSEMSLLAANAPNGAPSACATPAGAWSEADAIEAALLRDGAVQLPVLVGQETLADMQAAFASRLRYFRWNNVDGYARTERMRHMVEDALTLSQGFVDIGIHPLVTEVVRRYVGANARLCEAKGWRSGATTKDFHGWHGDAWYDIDKSPDVIPREVKLAFYLTDVDSGAFQYLKGTHGKRPPRPLSREDKLQLPMDKLIEFKGAAGTAVMFDTSGIHRQGIPIYTPRNAVFYNYHEPDVALQKEDVDYYRYHPLLLNAAFLGNLSPAQMQLLGFGCKSQYQPNFVRRPSRPIAHSVLTAANAMDVTLSPWINRVRSKIGQMKWR